MSESSNTSSPWPASSSAVVLAVGLGVSLFAAPAAAEDPKFAVSAELQPGSLGPRDEAVVALTIEVPQGWHLWSLDPGPGPRPTKIRSQGPVEWSGPWHGDPPRPAYVPGFKRTLFKYEGPPVRLYRRVALRKETPPGAHELQLEVRGQICTDRQCIDQTEVLTLPLRVEPTSSGAVVPSLPHLPLTEARPSEEPPDWLARMKAKGLFWYLLWAMAAGFGALATPCVFPVIPLTVSFFSKYSEARFSRTLALAGTYFATMVATFTIVGVAVSAIFGATEVQRMAQHPVFNLFVGLALVMLGLNLLGLFELQVPSAVLAAVNRLDDRFGASARRRGVTGASDFVVVSVAAVTATTVFFSCTVAFVGNVLAAAARGEWFWPSAGMFAFGVAFAAPFFVLALFPQTAQRMTGTAGGWMGATRVTLGFFELAAAAKFFSNVDLVLEWGWITRDAVLSLWVPLFALCGLYLLGKLAIGHESLAKKDGSVSVTQMLGATTMFALALYLAAGLFGNRPFPSWISAWLPPSVLPASADEGRLSWFRDLSKGRRQAEKAGQLLFVNYTGYTCANCRYMEESVFTANAVAAHLEAMTRVELYTDEMSKAGEWAKKDLLDRFETVALPFYSVEHSDGRVVATFAGAVNNPGEFEAFLASARAMARDGGEAVVAVADPVPEARSEALGVRLATTDLFTGRSVPAIATGKWNLVNFWATWCPPCMRELETFMARVGRELERRGGRFVAVALDYDEELAEARSFVDGVGIPRSSALRLPGDPTAEDLDSRFGFRGALPITALISPTGDIEWLHHAVVTEDGLRDVLAQHVGGAWGAAAPAVEPTD